MPRMGDLAALDNAFDVPGEQTYDRRLDQTWPGRLVQEAMGAVLAPGRALQATEPITTEQMIKPAADLAGVLAGGSMPMAEKGAAGVFGGRLAKTADLNALAKAEEMAAKGNAPVEITAATGWFKGADGKWRFEIPDAASKWIDSPQQFTGMSPQGTTRHASGPQPMGNVFDHPELYKAYPELANTDLSLGYLGPSMKGSFQRGSGVGDPATITIGRDLGQNGPAAMRSTNLHELQHNIQDIEGFATGGNTFGLKPGTPAWDIYQERLKAIKTPATEESLKASGTIGPDFTYKEYLKQHKDALKKPEQKKMLDRAAQDYAVQEGYRRLAGETEARNVQTRANYTPTDIRQKHPLLTQDVPTVDQFVKFREPMGSLAEPQMFIEKPPGIRAYHSSPHDFDKFDLAKIGTGEGAQMYGHGLYFAENPKVSGQGGQYWNQFMPRMPADERAAAVRLRAENFDREAAIKTTENIIKNAAYPERFADQMRALELLKSGQPVGPRTYEVNIRADPAHMLDWDKPLSGQPQAALDFAKQHWHGDPSPRLTGKDIYDAPGYKNRADTTAFFREAGIPGIKYLDEGSRFSQALYNDNPIANEARRFVEAAGGNSEKAAELFYKSNPAQSFGVSERDEIRRLIQMAGNKPTSNYVIFDPNLIRIDKKYVVPGAVAGAGGMGALAAQDGYRQ